MNYLVPVDANLESAAALRIEAVRLDFIQETMEQQAKTNILFLDACRNNPLARNLARALGTRSTDIGRGLAPVESGAGTLISFSTQPGNVALDGSGRNSPYSGPLIKAIATPGEDVLSMLTAVRNAVMAATGDKQVPWDNNALRAKFYFNPAPASAPGVPVAPLSPDAQTWSLIQNSQSEAVLEEFARRFPDSVFAGFAKARVEELKHSRIPTSEGSASSWWPWSSSQRPEPEKPKQTRIDRLEPPKPLATFQTAATEAILVDAGTGTILFEKNADKLFAPASMSKIMTLEILFKKLKAGEISMDTEFPASLYAWKTGGAPSRTTSMFVPLNQTAKVSDLIQGIAVQNANDGAIIVGEGLGGTDEAFGQMMTEEARGIGLERSTFGNSSGLPNPVNLATARDLVKLSIHIIKEYPEYYKYFGQREFKYRNSNFKSTNPLFNAAIPVDGLKTGFTEGAGYGIAASAESGGRRLVAVMNGFELDKDRREETSKALSWGFVNFKSYKVFDKDEIVGTAKVWGETKRSVPVRTNAEARILLPVAAKDLRVKADIFYRGPLKLPIQEGAKVAELRIASESTGSSNWVPLYAAASLDDVRSSGGEEAIDTYSEAVNACVR